MRESCSVGLKNLVVISFVWRTIRHTEAMLREAERLGIMVGKRYLCTGPILWENQTTLENAQNQLREVIARDHIQSGRHSMVDGE